MKNLVKAALHYMIQASGIHLSIQNGASLTNYQELRFEYTAHQAINRVVKKKTKNIIYTVYRNYIFLYRSLKQFTKELVKKM